MKRWWGEDFFFAPYRPGDGAWRLKRLFRRLAPEDSVLRKWIAALRRRAGKAPRFTTALRDLYDPSIEQALERIVAGRRFKAVIVEYLIQAPVLRRIEGTVRRLIDTIEVFALDSDAARSNAGKTWLSVTAEEELEALRQADVVLAIQDQDAVALRAKGVARVETVGHPVDIAASPIKEALQSKDILFAASDHPFNVEGLKWFATEIYPKVASSVPPNRIVVVGGICSVLNRDLPFRFEGRVKDLTPYYHRSRAVITPVINGTGLKIKLIEALGQGKAVVATAHAAKGLEAGADTAYLYAGDSHSFASAIQRVMQDDGVCRALMVGASDFVARWNAQQRDALQRAVEE
jgi:hypothetical protein